MKTIPEYIKATEADRENAERYLRGKHFPEPVKLTSIEESYSGVYGWQYTLYYAKYGITLKETLSQCTFKML